MATTGLTDSTKGGLLYWEGKGDKIKEGEDPDKKRRG